MSKIVIDVENLSKVYDLGTISSGTISRDLSSAWARFRGKEDPNSRITVGNDLNIVNGVGRVWALRDINLKVNQGEVLGIIGKNGAGKSTLLKILSRITSPTNGQVKIRGRIASLLEIGTGFHLELTGRENIYLNGAIMGMTKKEIDSKLDAIIDFSGIEKYIDTPVKRYSSGMGVRLGFSVAAHLEPEILVVDEVLAVGDVEFQK
jgi:lipopolysaccharide transport system ATP-binding protein